MTAPLAAALRAAAAGLLPGEAGTGLLIAHATFLHRHDFTTRFTTTTAASLTGSTPMAWISWDDALTALTAGQIPASSGEAAILRLAASLAAGCPVSLRDTIPSLDHRNLNHVTTAIRHAAGHRH
jgi:hypothetical protein